MKRNIATTDPQYVEMEEDLFELDLNNDIKKRSRFWKLKVGTKVKVSIDGKEFVGTVAGFNKDLQVGRVMYILTSPQHFIYLDALIQGSDEEVNIDVIN